MIAKRPIANAAWKDLHDQPGFYASYAETYTQRLLEMLITPGDLGFDGDPAEVWPEIALRFTLSQPGVHSAIVGTTNPRHVAQNLKALDNGPLPEEVVAKLRTAFIAAEKQSGENWKGLT